MINNEVKDKNFYIQIKAKTEPTKSDNISRDNSVLSPPSN